MVAAFIESLHNLLDRILKIDERLVLLKKINQEIEKLKRFGHHLSVKT